MPPFHVSLRLHLFLEGSQGDARIQIMTRQSQVSFFSNRVTERRERAASVDVSQFYDIFSNNFSKALTSKVPPWRVECVIFT